MPDKIIKAMRGAAVALTPGQPDDTTQSIDLSFLSEESGINYWPGVGFVHEHIVVSPQSVDLAFLNSGNAPLLADHDPERQIGVVSGNARIENQDGRPVARAVVRFSPNDPNGVIYYKDVRDKIRTNVSCQYDVLAYNPMGVDPTDGYPIMQATSISVGEISIVSMPFDRTVGTDRSAKREETEGKQPAEQPKTTEENTMTEQEKAALEAEKSAAVEAARSEGIKVGEAEGAKRAASETLSRAGDILDYAESFGFDLKAARKFIQDGKSLAEFRDHVKAERAKNPNQTPIDANAGVIGLDKKEAKRFSMFKALNAQRTGNWKGAEFEKEVLEASEKKFEETGRRAQHGGFLLPTDIVGKRTKRAGIAYGGGSGSGAALVATDTMSDSLIDALFANTVVGNLAGLTFDGLVGNVTVPRVAGKSGVTWINPETGTTTESDPTFDAVTLKPCYAVGKSVITYSMQKQSSIALDAFLEKHLAQCLGEALDYAFINGKTANGQPVGILNAGIGSVSAGGAALTYAKVLELIKKVKKNNVDGANVSFLTNPDVEAQLSATPTIAGVLSQMVWQDGADGIGRIKGRPAYVSTNVPSDLGAGTNQSALICGDFSQTILGLWSGMELRLDPYTSADNGSLIVRAFYPVDFNVGRPGAFAAATDILA